LPEKKRQLQEAINSVSPSGDYNYKNTAGTTLCSIGSVTLDSGHN